MTENGHAFENMDGESRLVAIEDFPFEKLFADMDGETTPDEIRQARVDGAEKAVFWMLDRIISKHTPGTNSRAACRQTGYRAIMLAFTLHHPSVMQMKSLRAFAKTVGVSKQSASKSSRKIRKQFGMA